MKKLLFFTLLIIAVLFFSRANAQNFPSELWHEGKVVLIEGDTVKGQIKYDFDNDLVQVNTDNVLKTYSSRKILFFEILDKTTGSYRQFYALPFNIHSDYEVPILFEVLYEGKLTLLAREQIVTENVSSSAYDYYYYPTFPNYNYTRERLAYTFFFLEQNGEIEYYTLKKNDLLSTFGDHSKEIKQYMKKNNLKHDNLRDLIKITAYYNALID